MSTPAKIPPKPGKDTVYIDVDDEITAIIDKVEGAKEKVVALVLPKRSTVLQSVVNMRLLKRNAEKAGKNVVLITGEEALLPLAGAVGLHVAKNLQSKPEVPLLPAGMDAKAVPITELPEEISAEAEEPSTKLDYHRTVGELASKHAEDDNEAIALDDEDAEEDALPAAAKKSKVPKDKRVKVPNFDRFRLLLFGSGALLILLIAFIVLAIFVLPKATITINTGSTPVSANLTLNAADSVKTLDEQGDNIPAAVKTTNQTQTQSVPATGQQNNGTKATGTVTLVNCNNSAVSVPAGTAISQGNLTYIIQPPSASLPPGNFDSHGNCKTSGSQASSAMANITAQSGGSNYNTTISGASVSGVSGVTVSGSASGGTDNNVTVVSQTDINNAAAKLTGGDNSIFTKNYEDQLANQGLYVLTSTLKAAAPTTTASPALGQPATNTTVTTTISYTVLTVQKSDLTKVLTDALNAQINATKQKITDTNILGNASISVQSQTSPSVATLSVSESTTAVPIIDQNSIKKQAVGQKSGDIQASVENLPGVKSVTVNMSPFWVSKAPKVSKITVKLVPVSSSSSGG